MLKPKHSSGYTPVPYAQVAILILVRLAEPVSYTVIFPFINQMIEELGVTDNPDRVGFYSGLVESVFSFVQFFTVYHWATLSDKIGRKPVILMGLTGVTISGALFGLTTNFWAMIFVRCVSGALNGNVAVVKASLGDITDDSNSTDAFALYGLTWTVGSIFGNSLGGILSHPYERFPALFGSWDILRIHPYLLPCATAALVTLMGIIFCLAFYRESLPSIVEGHVQPTTLSLKMFSPSHRRSGSALSISAQSNISETETLVEPESPGSPGSPDSPSTERLLAKSNPGIDSNGLEATKKWGFRQLMRHRPVQILSATMFLQSFVGGAWSAGSLLFFFDKSNGLGMSPPAIGTAMAVNGFWSIVCQLVFLNPIRRRLGISLAYKCLTAGWILVWLLLPMLRRLLEAVETPLPQENPFDPIRYPEKRGWVLTIAVNLMLSFVTVVGLANSLLMVLINYSAPTRSTLGAVNGISTAVGCMARVLGPSIVSALFAISMDGHVLGGRLWWLFMVVASICCSIATLFVASDPKPVNRLSSIPEEDEEVLDEQDDWQYEQDGKRSRSSLTVGRPSTEA